MKQRVFICKHCGNLIAMVKDTGVPVVCCGEKMHELIPGTTDASVQRRSLCLRTGRVRRGCAAFCINARAGKKRGEHPCQYCFRRGQRYCKCNSCFYRVLIYYY